MHFITLSKGLVIAATTAFLMACGGGSPADKMMGYQEKILSILESNKKDLDNAAKEISAYIESNKDEMKATMGAMAKMTEELKNDPEKAAKMMAEFGEKQEAMQKRMEELEKEVPGIKDHAGIRDATMAMAKMMME
jgi:hypothetical protein